MFSLRRNFRAFTLVELMVVLMIISVSVTIALPFCKRSNQGLKMRQACDDIAQTIRYAIDLAEKDNKKTKFVFDSKYSSYYLQQENEGHFEALNDFTRKERFIGNIQLYDSKGFEQEKNTYFFVFDPEIPWPDGYLTFAAEDMMITININSRYVEIKDQNF
ncbi:MAG: prepilin-type N-terminal cleavage/methylation domain-containing protein [Phycisphaerae bacterium]|nr:prepilin-type N-terminal cleavage/methylation domain-containing protein [Phycisphaerae bacterium]